MRALGYLLCAGAVSGLLALTTTTASAQSTSVVVTTCGTQTYATTAASGVRQYPTQDTTGAACSSAGGGGGGGVAGFTSTASPAAVAAGTNKPANIDSASGALFIEPVKPGTTTTIDLSAPSGVLGVNGTTIATNANPFPTNVAQLNGAVPSLTNPIWIANAEAADTTGTFTNATQTTSVTNSGADGYASALLSVNGTYGTATGVFEASDDAGSTYYSIICTRSDGSAQETGYTSLTNVNRQWSCPISGNDTVRIRSTAVASGTVNARVGITAPPNNSGIVGGTVSISQATPGTTNAVAIKDINNVAPDFTTTAPTAQVGPYPSKNTAGVVSSATFETCSSGNVANATVACTLATAVGKTTYITGFTMTGDGATVGLAVSCTLTGTITGTMTYTFGYPVGVAVSAQPLNVQFSYPVAASTTNTTIVVSCPASGTGGTNAAISATGFQL